MKILVIKTGAIGDVLRCTFLAQALKEKYKKLSPRIYWLTAENAKLLFINNPYVDNFLIENEATLKKLKKISFDLIVNLEESEKMCKLASYLKPKKIQGFYYDFNRDKIVPSDSAKEWFDMSLLGKKPENDILKRKNKKTHRQLMSEIIQLKAWKKFEPFLRLTMKQRKIAEVFLRRHNLSKQDLIIGINTGSSDRWQKSLPVKKTAQLIDELYKKFNASIILFGGPNEIKRNKEIHKMSKSPIIDAGCGNDLVEFPALISVCSLFITTDSLGLHVALTLKRKTICLIGPTSASEIDMLGLGEKVVSSSKCICCYKKDCKSMEKIKISEVVKKTKKLLNESITLLITAFKEPKSIGRALDAALNQKTSRKYDVLVSAPDKETLDVVKKYQKSHKNLKIFKDPGKGKSYALNLIFKKIKTDLLILTDGDVYISDNVVEEFSNLFLDPEIGCATGQPVPVESKKTMFGYWANFLFDSAHKLRKEAYRNYGFLECSGYLFAFRKKIINKIPLDVAEDTIIPYFFWEKGYRIGYSPDAKVYVKNADNLSDWIEQKTRTSKAHETIDRYADTKTTPRVKTFKIEAVKGMKWLLNYPKNLRQVYWAVLLIVFRFYVWMKVFYDTKIKNRHYHDAWKRVESTK